MTQANAFSSQADPRGSLAANHTPTLILTGECNYIKWEVTYEYKRTLPNSTLLYIPGAGHLIYLEQPALFFASVRAFLLDQPLPLKPYMASQPPSGH
jgi:pimeloyl-ACP methyl ester carboxylesterase